jgi:hypothetical protein
MRDFSMCSAVLAALTSFLATPVISSSAEANVVVVVGDPTQNGIIASGAGGLNFTPASVNPAHAATDTSRAALNQQEGQIILSFDVDGGGWCSTGGYPQNPFYGSIPILIQGTAGEAQGTPVTIRLDPSFGGLAPAGAIVLVFVDGIQYEVSQTHLIEGLTVGDTFRYWVYLSGSKTVSAQLLAFLSVELPGVGQSPSQTGKRISITLPDEGRVYPTAPVRVEVKLARGARASDFRAFLNQHDVTSRFAPAGERDCNPGHCELAATVDLPDGLQRGSNMLRVEVREPNGSMSQTTRTFFVNGPTANAGSD